MAGGRQGKKTYCHMVEQTMRDWASAEVSFVTAADQPVWSCLHQARIAWERRPHAHVKGRSDHGHQ
eukprot:14822616-Alexandrium_andersonii.AAC.1